MKTKNILIAAACIASLGLGSAYAASEGWLSNFEEAKKQAGSENKALLVDFTGSDWCSWCIKLNEEVFSHQEFKNGVKDKFVLTEIDYPNDTSKLEPETLAQNEVLKEKYSIQGYPTILLMDAEGKPFAKTGYQEGGPEKYVSQLDELLKIQKVRDENFSKAETLEGTEKAKILVSTLKAMPLSEDLIANFYGDKIEAIKAADPKDESGYVKSMEASQRFSKFQSELDELAGQKEDFEGALKMTEETLAEGRLEGRMLQQTTLVKGMLQAETGKLEEAMTTLEDAKKIVPDGELVGQIEMVMEKIKSQQKSAE